MTSGQFGKALGFAIRKDIPEIVELMLRKCPRDLIAQLIIPGDRMPLDEGKEKPNIRERQERSRRAGLIVCSRTSSLYPVFFLRSFPLVFLLPPLLWINEEKC